MINLNEILYQNDKIGITECGDPSLDFSWADNINKVKKAILITKNLSSDEFRELILNFKHKIILHCTITGFGTSRIEPNIPLYKDSFKYVEKLIYDGFNPNQLVIRIDPLFIPKIQKIHLKNVSNFCLSNNISRIRFSFIDFYKHVIYRLNNLSEDYYNQYGLNFSLKPEVKNEFLEEIEKLKTEKLRFEVCAENIPLRFKQVVDCLGCISVRDLDIFGLEYNVSNLKKSNQRNSCLCISNKFELLNTKKQCQYKCIYCYWRD